MLNIFNQNTFVGYTATPYANLFISQDYNEELTTTVKNKQYKIGEDLFPRDFIINIKAPTNYIGAAKIFGYENANPELTKEPLDIFREINDYDPPFFSTMLFALLATASTPRQAPFPAKKAATWPGKALTARQRHRT